MMIKTSMMFVCGIAVAALGVLGCGGTAHEQPAAPAASGAPAAGGGEILKPDEATSFCVQLHEQMASCAGEFIDMNLELRAKYFPPFAKEIADPAARAEMRKVGIEETLADGTGPLEPRIARCKEYAEHGPPVPRSAVAQAQTCFAMTSCAQKVDCLRPSQEERYQQRAKEPGDSAP